jgi:hypothetical protein
MDVRNVKRFVVIVSVMVLFIAAVVLIGSQPVQAGKGCPMVKNASDANCPAGAKAKDPNSCPKAKDPNCSTKK